MTSQEQIDDGCATVKQSEHVARLYDEIAPTHDASYTDAVSLYENRVLRNLLTPLVSSATSILDLGCGTGLFLDLGFRPNPKHYLGVDVSHRMLSFARSKYRGYRFEQSDFCVRPLPPADLVLALNGPLSFVLTQDFDFLKRAMIPEGKFLVTLLGKGEGIYERFDRGSPDCGPFKVRRHSVRSAVKSLSNLKIDGIRGLNACLPLGRPALWRWVANAVLEVARPSWTEHIVIWGKRV